MAATAERPSVRLRVQGDLADLDDLVRGTPLPSRDLAARLDGDELGERAAAASLPSQELAARFGSLLADPSTAPPERSGGGVAAGAPPTPAPNGTPQPADDPVGRTIGLLERIHGGALEGDRPPSEFEAPGAFAPSPQADVSRGLAKSVQGQPEAVQWDLGGVVGGALAGVVGQGPRSLEQALRRGAEEAPTPDIPSLPFAGGPFAPYHPNKPVRDPEIERKIQAGEDLTVADLVGALAKATSAQYQSTPAAIGGLPGVPLGTSEAELASSFAAGGLEASGGGARGGGGVGGLVRAAGEVGAGGGDLLASAGRASGESGTLGERAVEAAGGAIGRDPRAPPLPGLDPGDFARGPRPAPEMPPVAVTPGRRPGRAAQPALGPEAARAPPATTNLDRLRLLGQASRLAATSTQILNLGGNVVHSLADTFVTKPLEVAADALRARLTGRERQQFLEEVLPQARGSVHGALAGLRSVPSILAHGVDPAALERYEARGFAAAGLLPERLRGAAPVVDAVAEMPLRQLAAADAVATDAAFTSHANALAVRQARREGLTGAAVGRRAEEIVGDLTQYPRIAREATELARKAVYQGAHPELDWLRRLKAGKLGLALDQVVPFVSTPYDVVAQGLGLNPLQVIKAVQDVRAGRDLAANRRVAQAVAGTVLTGAGLGLAQSGYLTGAPPDDDTERSTLPEGWKPFSLRLPVGDGAVYVPIALFGHFAIPLGIGAIAGDALRRGQDPEGVATALAGVPGGIVKFLGEQTFLDGARTVGRLLDDPARWSETLVEGLATPLMPYSALQRQVDQAFGGASRDPRGAIEALLASTPVLNEAAGVPTRRTALGEERRGVSGPLAMVAGTRITAERDEPTLRVLRSARVGLGRQGATWRGLPLTDEERRAIDARGGELIRERVAPLADDAEFAALPLARRGAILERYRDQALEAARKEVMDRLSDAELDRRRQMKQRAEETRRPVLSVPGSPFRTPD